MKYLFFTFWLCRNNGRHFLVQWKCNLVDYPLATGYKDNSYHCWKIPFNVQVRDVCLWSWACAEADFLSQTYLQQGEITNIRETSRLHCSHGTWLPNNTSLLSSAHIFLACHLNLSQTLQFYPWKPIQIYFFGVSWHSSQSRKAHWALLVAKQKLVLGNKMFQWPAADQQDVMNTTVLSVD